MTIALDFARTAPTIHARSRIRGLHLRFTDLDWTTGEGPTVEGHSEPLLMAMAGRSTTNELTGPGLPTLTARIT
jgi:hypothetical protein